MYQTSALENGKRITIILIPLILTRTDLTTALTMKPMICYS